MLNNCFSPRVKLSPSVTLMWRLQVEVYLHLVVRENGRCGLLIWHMISIMFTFVWTIGWHLSAGIVAMGGMDNSSSCNHGYHRQVSSSCFTWSVLCPSMAKCSAGGIFQWRNLFQLLLALWSCIYQALQVTLLSLPFLRFPFLSPYFPFLFSSPLSPSSSVLLRPPPPLLSSSPPPPPSLFPSLFPFFLSFPSSSPIPHRLQACGHIQARLAVKTWMELIWPTGLLLTTSALSLLQLPMEENLMPQGVGKRGQMFHFVKQR